MPGPMALRPVSPLDLGLGRHDLSGYQATADVVGSRSVARDDAEERSQCPGTSASAGAGQLQDSLIAPTPFDTLIRPQPIVVVESSA